MMKTEASGEYVPHQGTVLQGNLSGFYVVPALKNEYLQ